MNQKYQQHLYTATLAEIRKALSDDRITQAHIGQALGIKQSAVSTLLSGKSRMTMDQFFILCELVGVAPQTLLQKAVSLSSQTIPMSPQVESTLYRSEVHLLLYCAAIRELSLSEIKLFGVTVGEVQQAAEDLIKVDLLVKKKNKYVQKNPQLIYLPSSRLKSSQAHLQIMNRSWNLFDRRYNDREFIATKFNLVRLDRFSVAQTKEIEAAMWKVYEKIDSIRQANQANAYSDDPNMPVWNIHMMLMTPFDP